MNRKSTTPTDKNHWLQMRKKNLNSTEVSALFDVNPYLTEFELWHQKKDDALAPFEENERMIWGNLLEPAIAERAAMKNNWMHRPMKDYYELPDIRIGSSFDFRIVEMNPAKSTPTKRWLDTVATMEIKNVDSLEFYKKWVVEDDEDGNSEIEAPPHIEIQAQVQMLVSGLKKVYLCVLVGGNDLKIIERDANPEMQEIILARCAEFWKSIDENCQPAIDYNKDSSFLITLYGTAEQDSAKTVDDFEQKEALIDMVESYLNANENLKLLTEKKERYKAQILEIIGDTHKVKGLEWSISAGNIDPVEIKAHVRSGRRDFRINKKVKKAASE